MLVDDGDAVESRIGRVVATAIEVIRLVLAKLAGAKQVYDLVEREKNEGLLVLHLLIAFYPR
jgi:uncharacterized membrane protein